MKKTLFNKFLWITFGFVLVCGAFAFAQEDLWSWMDDLLMDMNFGYNSSTDIRIESVTDDKIVIWSDVVEWELGEQIELYVAMYSEYPISELLDNSSKLWDVEEKEFDIGDNDWKDKFEVELDVSRDDIDPDTVYYVSLIPKDDFGMPWDLSKEYCFLVSSHSYGEGDECDGLEGNWWWININYPSWIKFVWENWNSYSKSDFVTPKVVSNSEANELDGVLSVVKIWIDNKKVLFEDSSGNKEYVDVVIPVSSSQNGKTVKIYYSDDWDDWDYLTEARVSWSEVNFETSHFTYFAVTSNSAGHSAAGPDMKLANIVPSVNKENGEVTFRWISLDGADKIELFHRDEADEKFEKLDTVDMDDEFYQFTVDRVGEHIVKFVPINNGIPVGVEIYKPFIVPEIGTEPNPDPDPNPNPPVTWITKVPTVGPKENIIMILIVAMLGYFVYRKVLSRRHS